MRLARLALAAGLLGLPGCYETPLPPCAFSCGSSGACPDGYSCRADSWCRRDDVADDFACAPPGAPDGATPDGATADGGVPPDGGDRPDADPPDAGDPPDSAVIDGPLPDAPPAELPAGD